MKTGVIVSWAAHGIVAAAFAAAGGFKLLDPARFADDVGHYRLVTPWAAGLAAVYLPWLEITLAAALVAPSTRAAARWLAGGLLLGFCVALTSTLVRGIDLRCGCFGAASATGAAAALIRNAALLACLLAGAWAERSRGKPV